MIEWLAALVSIAVIGGLFRALDNKIDKLESLHQRLESWMMQKQQTDLAILQEIGRILALKSTSTTLLDFSLDRWTYETAYEALRLYFRQLSHDVTIHKRRPKNGKEKEKKKER